MIQKRRAVREQLFMRASRVLIPDDKRKSKYVPDIRFCVNAENDDTTPRVRIDMMTVG